MLGSYAVLMALWFWTRLNNFYWFTYLIATQMFFPKGLEHFNIHTRICSLFIIILFLMQIYWTVLLLQMFLAFTKTGSTTDL